MSPPARTPPDPPRESRPRSDGDHELDRPAGTVRSGLRWNSIGNGGVQLVHYLVSLALFQLIAADEVGMMAKALVITGFLDFFVVLGTGQVIVQRKRVTPEFLATVFAMNVVLAGVCSALLIGLSQPLSSVLTNVARDGAEQAREFGSVLRVMSLLFPLTALGLVHRSLLVRRLAFQSIFVADLAKGIAYGAVAIVLAVQGFGVWAFVWGTLAGSAAGALACWAASPWMPRAAFQLRLAREVYDFCAPLLGAQLSHYLFQNADRVIIGRFLGDQALGVYFFAWRLVLFPVRSVTLILVGVLTPAFSRLQDDLGAMRTMYLRAVGGIALLCLPALTGVAVVAGPLLGALFPDWTEAALLIALLCPAGMVRSLASSTAPLFVATGNTRSLFRWSVVFGSVTVASYFVGLPWGVTGVAAAFCASEVSTAWPRFAIPFRFIELRFARFLAEIAPYVLACVLMGASVLGARSVSAALGAGAGLELTLAVAVGVAVYGACLVGYRPRGLDDLLSLALPGRKLRPPAPTGR